MTKEDWKNVERQLAVTYGHIKLKIDGYEVTVNVEPRKNLKVVLAVYVNGEIQTKWMDRTAI